MLLQFCLCRKPWSTCRVQVPLPRRAQSPDLSERPVESLIVSRCAKLPQSCTRAFPSKAQVPLDMRAFPPRPYSTASKTPACVLDTCRVTGRTSCSGKRQLLGSCRTSSDAGCVQSGSLRGRTHHHHCRIVLGVEGFIPASPTESSSRFTLFFFCKMDTKTYVLPTHKVV